MAWLDSLAREGEGLSADITAILQDCQAALRDVPGTSGLFFRTFSYICKQF